MTYTKKEPRYTNLRIQETQDCVIINYNNCLTENMCNKTTGKKNKSFVAVFVIPLV